MSEFYLVWSFVGTVSITLLIIVEFIVIPNLRYYIKLRKREKEIVDDVLFLYQKINSESTFIEGQILAIVILLELTVLPWGIFTSAVILKSTLIISIFIKLKIEKQREIVFKNYDNPYPLSL